MSGTVSTLTPGWLDPAARDHGMITASAGLSTRGAGFLSMEGPEAVDFLNRLSTNDLRGLKEGSLRATILTTEKGRMIDLVHVLNMGQRVMLVTGEGNSHGVKSWLEKFIIMENIIIADVTPDYGRISLLGPDALSIINQFSACHLTEGDSSTITVMESRGEGGLLFYCNPEWPLPMIDLIGSTMAIESALNDLSAKQAAHPQPGQARIVGSQAVEMMRVESGVPRFDAEINDRVNPLEAGLGKFVSLTKGCYIGQEVIARLDTYKKLQRSIRGFIFPKTYENLSPGTLFSQGTEVGWTSSHVVSYAMGTQVALGYLKLIPVGDDIRFSLAGSTAEIPVTVVDLPFLPVPGGGSPPK